jgi:hypothetical protein
MVGMAKDGFNPIVFILPTEAFRHGKKPSFSFSNQMLASGRYVIRRNPYNVQKHKVRLER